MVSKNIPLSWILYFLMVCLFVQTSQAAKSLFSVDSHSGPITRAYSIEGTTLAGPVKIIDEMFGLGLDLGISSCYNKFIIAGQ